MDILGRSGVPEALKLTLVPRIPYNKKRRKLRRFP